MSNNLKINYKDLNNYFYYLNKSELFNSKKNFNYLFILKNQTIYIKESN